MVTIVCVDTGEGSKIVEGIKDGILVVETSITVIVLINYAYNQEVNGT
jgi:hypothetical protein